MEQEHKTEEEKPNSSEQTTEQQSKKSSETLLEKLKKDPRFKVMNGKPGAPKSVILGF